MNILIVFSLFSFANATLRIPLVFPFIQCNIRLSQLDFDVYSFEKYDSYFDEDSSLTFPELGVYIGPKGIEEYVRFFDEDTNPFLEKVKDVDS